MLANHILLGTLPIPCVPCICMYSKFCIRFLSNAKKKKKLKFPLNDIRCRKTVKGGINTVYD